MIGEWLALLGACWGFVRCLLDNTTGKLQLLLSHIESSLVSFEHTIVLPLPVHSQEKKKRVKKTRHTGKISKPVFQLDLRQLSDRVSTF